jgi:hypothetical protein
MAGAHWCGCGVRFHFGYAIAGILIGLSAAPIFAIQFYNYSATSFAFISSVFAAGERQRVECTHTHIQC